MLYGGLAGAIYKSTRGPKPMILSAVLGAGISQCYYYCWSNGFFDLSAKSNEAGMHFGKV